MLITIIIQSTHVLCDTYLYLVYQVYCLLNKSSDLVKMWLNKLLCLLIMCLYIVNLLSDLLYTVLYLQNHHLIHSTRQKTSHEQRGAILCERGLNVPISLPVPVPVLSPCTWRGNFHTLPFETSSVSSVTLCLVRVYLRSLTPAASTLWIKCLISDLRTLTWQERKWPIVETSPSEVYKFPEISRLIFLQPSATLSTIQGRVYEVEAPNNVWHIDGNHKRIRWKLVIHGAIDCFFWVIQFLNCSTNNRAETVWIQSCMYILCTYTLGYLHWWKCSLSLG